MAERKTSDKSNGCYANYLKIGQNAFEILLVFGHLYLDDSFDDQEALFHTRIVTTPVYAKAFLRVLRNCIDQYEKAFGNIPEEQEELDETQKSDQRWSG